MFPLIAIAAFFILGITFFVLGKDDFGIQRVKEVSDDTSINKKKVINPESDTNDESSKEKKELVIPESSSVIDSVSNTSD